jgi:hypothetical protein
VRVGGGAFTITLDLIWAQVSILWSVKWLKVSEPKSNILNLILKMNFNIGFQTHNGIPKKSMKS